MQILAVCVFVMLSFLHVNVWGKTGQACDYYRTAPKDPFDKTLYEGQWYVHQMWDYNASNMDSINYNCFVQFRTPDENGYHDLKEITVDKDDRFPLVQMDGKTIFDPSGVGRYTYIHPSAEFNDTVWTILETDYDRFAIEWYCWDKSDGLSVCYVIILSRVPEVQPDTQEYINTVLENCLIDGSELRTLNIASCPEELLPELVGEFFGALGPLGAKVFGATLKGLLGE